MSLPQQKPTPQKPLPLPPDVDGYAPPPQLKPKNPRRRKTVNSETSSIQSTNSLILNELLETEKVYASDLQLIWNIFHKSATKSTRLQRSKSVNSSSSTGSHRNYKQLIETDFVCTPQAEIEAYELSKKAFPGSTTLTNSFFQSDQQVLSHENIRLIFLNIHPIMLWTLEFVELLENTITNGNNIGELFCQYIPSHFEPLYLYYCSRQTSSNNRLVQLLQNDARVQAWHTDCSNQLQGQSNAWDLPSLLVKPFQRILKYPLLLNNLIKCNENKFGVSSLQKALTDLQSLAERINDAKFRKDSVDHILLTVGSLPNDDTSTRSPQIPSSSTSTPNTLKKTPPLPSKKSRTFLRRRAKSTTHPNSSTSSVASSPLQTSQNLAIEHAQNNGPPVYAHQESIVFDRCVGMLDYQLQQLTTFTRNINDWINLISLELNQLAKFVGRWYATSSLEGLSVVENESTMTIEAYARVIREIFKRPYATLVKKIDSRIHYRLKQIMKLTSNPRIIIVRRNELKREFEESTSAIPSKSRWSSTQLIANAHEAFEVFHALDVQLRLELPVLVRGMKKALQGVLHDFVKIQTEYYQQSHELRQMWCQQWCTFNHEHTPERILKDWQIRFGIISDRLDKLNLQIAPTYDIPHRPEAEKSDKDATVRRRGASLSNQNYNHTFDRLSMSDDNHGESTHTHTTNTSQRSSGIYLDSPPTPSSMSHSHDKSPTPSLYTRMLPQLSLDSYRTAFSKQPPHTDKLDDASVQLSLNSFDAETERLACFMQRDIGGLGLKWDEGDEEVSERH
ncbi:hypothetical protein E3P99_02068 [Wallemia hederae]|uniref:DH domain-containing protein n=1 Tax=Wallemia hederae TaxID=1540922 RepID=A0A4T0FMT1_9BASI|nr:hypothetical protein E3P99_02068 [Wallemia hederae]